MRPNTYLSFRKHRTCQTPRQTADGWDLCLLSHWSSIGWTFRPRCQTGAGRCYHSGVYRGCTLVSRLRVRSAIIMETDRGLSRPQQPPNCPEFGNLLQPSLHRASLRPGKAALRPGGSLQMRPIDKTALDID